MDSPRAAAQAQKEEEVTGPLAFDKRGLRLFPGCCVVYAKADRLVYGVVARVLVLDHRAAVVVQLCSAKRRAFLQEETKPASEVMRLEQI